LQRGERKSLFTAKLDRRGGAHVDGGGKRSSSYLRPVGGRGARWRSGDKFRRRKGKKEKLLRFSRVEKEGVFCPFGEEGFTTGHPKRNKHKRRRAFLHSRKKESLKLNCPKKFGVPGTVRI